MLEKANRLLQILANTSFHKSSTPEYPLSSGIMSRYYIDCKVALSYPEARELTGELILEKIKNDSVNAVGGLELGAYPIAIAVSDAAYRHQRKINAFVVRKQPKLHGLKKYAEGSISRNDKVIIVDDVITTGKSTIDAINKVREEGLEIVKVIAIVDRKEADGKKNIEACGVLFEALFTLDQLIACKEGRL